MSDVAEQIIAAVKPHLKPDASIGGTIKVNMGEEGTIFFDGAAAPAQITMDDKPADATLVCSAETFAKMMSGEIDGMRAFVMGALKIEGDMGLAGKLSNLFQKP